MDSSSTNTCTLKNNKLNLTDGGFCDQPFKVWMTPQWRERKKTPYKNDLLDRIAQFELYLKD
jgi:hypothetical protein